MDVYAVNAFTFWDMMIEGLYYFERTCKILSDKIGFFVKQDLSPTTEEILDEEELKKHKVFYFSGHGLYSEPVNRDGEYFWGIVVYNTVLGFKVKKYTYEISPKDIMSLNLPEYDLVFINTCGSGYNSGYDEISFKKAFNAKGYIGWKYSPDILQALKFGYVFFDECKNIDKDTGKRKTIYKAFEFACDKLNIDKGIFFISDETKEIILGE